MADINHIGFVRHPRARRYVIRVADDGTVRLSDTRYFLTSVDPGSITADELLASVRNHWQIENSLFHVRDVTFREDHCRVRSGSAPQALAAIRDATLNLIRKTGQKPRSAREAFAEQKWKAIRLVRAA